MQYDFDEIIDRRGTGALKYEALLPRSYCHLHRSMPQTHIENEMHHVLFLQSQ